MLYIDLVEGTKFDLMCRKTCPFQKQTLHIQVQKMSLIDSLSEHPAAYLSRSLLRGRAGPDTVFVIEKRPSAFDKQR